MENLPLSGKEGVCSMNRRRIKPSRKRGMTLVELLITMIIGGIIMGAVSLLFVAFFRNFNMHDELAAAQQNGEMGLNLIESYVLQAGMGMPSISSADFQEAFNIAPVPVWQGWEGPVSAISGDTALRVLAARSTKPAIGATEEKIIETSGTSLTVQASSSFGGGKTLSDFVAEDDWVVFPGSRLPFLVTDPPSTNTSLQLQCSSMDTVHLFDSLHVLEEMEFFVKENDHGKKVLYKKNGVPTEIPVAAMDVQWNSASRSLQVVLLVKGKDKQSTMLPANYPPGWPGAALAGEDRYYRHVAVGRIWRIRN